MSDMNDLAFYAEAGSLWSVDDTAAWCRQMADALSDLQSAMLPLGLPEVLISGDTVSGFSEFERVAMGRGLFDDGNDPGLICSALNDLAIALRSAIRFLREKEPKWLTDAVGGPRSAMITLSELVEDSPSESESYEAGLGALQSRYEDLMTSTYQREEWSVFLSSWIPAIERCVIQLWDDAPWLRSLGFSVTQGPEYRTRPPRL
jgi:hypothetical protein